MHELLQGTHVAFRQQHQLPVAPISGLGGESGGEALFTLARQHRVVGLWSASLRPDWRRYTQGQLVHLARCEDAGIQVVRTLEMVAPGVFLIKGPVLASQAWAQQGLRHYDDLDLRCRRIPFARLAGALGRLGYRPEQDFRRIAQQWRFGWGAGFRHEDGLRVECNWRWFPPQYPGLERCLSLRGASTAVKLAGTQVQGAAPVAHLLHGCMHLVWHNWARLGWLVDVAGLLVRHPDVLTDARALAGAQGFVREVLERVCGMAHDLLGPLPGTFREVPTSQRVAIIARLEAGYRPSGLALERGEHLQYMQMHERWGYQLRRMMIPGDPDFVRWQLPVALAPAYWVLRPLRLPIRSLRSWQARF